MKSPDFTICLMFRKKEKREKNEYNFDYTV